jgi:hypothetical protein
MFTPLYNPNRVTIWGKPGIYTITATTSTIKPVSLVVAIE